MQTKNKVNIVIGKNII